MGSKLKHFVKHGPYTFENLLKLAIECAITGKGCADYIIEKHLHLFPAEELEKIFDAKNHCSKSDYILWKIGIEI
jgi:hypothetical protein